MTGSESDSDDNDKEGMSLLHRRSFVSKHRHDLNRLAADASHLKPMPVPEKQHDSEGSSEKWWNEFSLFAGEEPKSNKDRFQTVLIALFPCWRWMSVYTYKESLYKDIIAGLTVGFMVVPQGMSYAKLA
jgi:sulfate transporter 4